MGFSSLINSKLTSNGYGSRNGKKVTHIIPHHAAWPGASGLSIAKVLKNKGYSAHYCIGNSGEIVGSLDENYRPYTTANSIDQSAITMEVANSTGSPNWEISAAAYKSLVSLCVDICRRHGIKQLTWTGGTGGNLECHYMYVATACCGPYMKSKMDDLAEDVNRKLVEDVENVKFDKGTRFKLFGIQKKSTGKYFDYLPNRYGILNKDALIHDGYNDEFDYYKVWYNDKIWYINTEHVNLDMTYYNGERTAANLYIYEGVGTTFDRRVLLPKGTYVQVLRRYETDSSSKGWVQVSYKNPNTGKYEVGYMSGYYFEK